jgi:D-alanine-D-alanine ligase
MTLTIGIICGGRSGEHEVSLQSAWGIYRALDRARFVPILVAIDPDGYWRAGPAEALLLNPGDPARIRIDPRYEPVIPAGENGQGLLLSRSKGQEVARIDLFFPIVHGTDGEDGALQGLLRMMGVPFVGTDVLGSAVGMDKAVMKRLLRDAGLPVARWSEFTSVETALAALPGLERDLSLPLFVKPAALGSSVGVSKVGRSGEYEAAVREAFRYDRRILVEEAIAGREIECSVLGNRPPTQWPPQASLPGEVVPRKGFYSYAAKYLDPNGAGLVVPARLDEAIVARVQEMALRVFDAVEAEGLARVDLFLNPDGGLVVNEINTLPGFTPISMYPKLWEATGLPYADLLTRLIELGLERHREREKLLRKVDLAAGLEAQPGRES